MKESECIEREKSDGDLRNRIIRKKNQKKKSTQRDEKESWASRRILREWTHNIVEYIITL